MRKLIFILVCFLSLKATGQDSTKARKEYLGILRPADKYKEEKNWTEKEQSIVNEHFQRFIKMKNEGTLILAGRTELELNDPNMMGLVIFYAKDDKEALQFMMDDPAVKNKVMTVKVFPYNVAVSKCP